MKQQTLYNRNLQFKMGAIKIYIKWFPRLRQLVRKFLEQTIMLIGKLGKTQMRQSH